ncbi:hypothetical protein GCK72_025066 [Caenorhabditis remanei]|uniref:Protein kinase domain-containing protein n=1 Tax=Caenorhabditis remanei TaxID=31234 RepID=A0A6A5G242_CAERE|nr:hypothetical protein GCK72_025066 [Caenorhabditis remanei]KAF1748599.1 hypothetical protein GCK72_025066 [Caenorhabditis remanei]
MSQGHHHHHAALEEIEVVPSDDFNHRDARTSSVQGHRLLKRLGSGGYASVYLSERVNNTELFAMKVMKKWKIIKHDAIDHTEDELKIHKQLDSPFVIKLIVSFHTPTRVCMVLELAARRNLQEITDDRHALIYDFKIKCWLAEMVLGLEYLHYKRVMHRDIKRENMLLTCQGHIKISDFGLSKEGMDKDTFTKTKCGTVPCMCPEMLMRIPYTRSADIWGLGIIALELITGRSLFDSDNSQSIINKLTSMKSCNELEYPSNLTGEGLIFVRAILQFEPDRISLEGIRDHRYLEEVPWTSILEFTPLDSSYKMPRKEYSHRPVILSKCPALNGDDPFEGFDYLSDW